MHVLAVMADAKHKVAGIILNPSMLRLLSALRPFLVMFVPSPPHHGIEDKRDDQRDGREDGDEPPESSLGSSIIESTVTIAHVQNDRDYG